MKAGETGHAIASLHEIGRRPGKNKLGVPFEQEEGEDFRRWLPRNGEREDTS